MTWKKALGLCGLFWVPALPLHADSLGDAYRAFEKGQFEEAAKGFQSHAQKQPEDFDQLYNTGVALFQKGAHEEAMTYFDRAMQSPDPDLKSRSAYNKGVALAQQQKWEEAAAAFQNALSYDNDNKMIQDNLRFARMQKNQQKKEDQQQDQKKDGKSEEKLVEDPKGQLQGSKPEEKQAQNQTGQGQSPEQQKEEQGKDAQKQAGQEKSGQADAEKKAVEEKVAQEKPGQQGDKGQPTGGKPGDQQQQGERILTVKDLKKQEAEKILRSVDDRIGTYILTPEQANTEGKSRNGKDW